MAKPIATISEQASLLITFLRDRQEATWDELAAQVGETCREGRGYGWLATARRALQREYRHVWVTVPKVGIKLANPPEVIDSAAGEVSRVHKASWRGIKRLATIDFEALEAPERQRLNIVASHLGALHGITTAKAVQRLSGAVAVQQQKLELSKTLDAFRNGGEKKE